MDFSQAQTLAIILLKRSQQLPLDLETRLMAEGVDVPRFKERYSV